MNHRLASSLRLFPTTIVLLAWSMYASALSTPGAPLAIDDDVGDAHMPAQVLEDSGSTLLCVIDNDEDGRAQTGVSAQEPLRLPVTNIAVVNGVPGSPTVVDVAGCVTPKAAVAGNGNAIRFTTNADQFGTAEFFYGIESKNDKFEYGPNCSVDDIADDSCGYVTVVVTPVNDAPSFIKGANQAIAENAGAQNVAGWATSISKGPPNEGSQTLTFTTTTTNDAAFASLPDVDEATGNLTYEMKTGYNNATPITVTVTLTDNGGTANGGDNDFSDTFTIAVSGNNDDPIVTVPGAQNIDEDVQTTITGISVSDVDANDGTITTRLQVNNGTLNVTLSGSASISVGANNSADMTISGNLTDVSSTLGSVKYTSDLHYNGSDTLTVIANDGGNTGVGGGGDVSDTVSITVDPVNDVPTFTVGTDQAVDEDAGATTVVGFIADGSPGPANESGQTLSYNVSNDNNGLFAVQPAIDATGTLTYTPADDANGSATVTVSLSDDGGTANGGVDTSADQTFTITVNAVNDAPVLTVPGAQNIDEDAQTPIAGISVSDIDSSASDVTLDLSVTNGTLNLTQSGSEAISGNGTASVSVVGSVADAAGALASVLYTSDLNYNGPDTLSLSVDDGGNTGSGGNLTDSANVSITVVPVNDTPSISDIPDTATDEDTNITGIAFTVDEDDQTDLANEDSQVLTVTATSSDTTLIPNGNITVNFSDDATDATGGTIDISPALHRSGTATITVTADDGESLNNTVVDTFVVTVNAVADTPTLTVNNAVATDEDVAANLGINTALVDSDGSEALTVSISGLPAGAEISDGTNSSSAATTDVSSWVIGSITVVGAPHDDSDFTLTVTSTATEGSNGDFAQISDTIDVTVNPVADTPNLSVTSPITTDEDTESPSLGISASLVDTTNETLAVVLSGVPSDATVQDGVNSVTSSGGNIDVSTWTLGSITVTPAPNDVSNFTITVTARSTEVNDVSSTASNPQTIDVTVNPVNDPPSISDIADQTTDEDTPITGIAFTADEDNQGDVANEDSQTLTVTATSSDQTLLPDANIAVTFTDSGDATGGTIDITPAANQNGTVTVTVTVDDGQASNNTAVDTFVVTVNPVNDTPTISDIADQSTDEDTDITGIAFTVDEDDQGDLANEDSQTITVTVSSSDQTLVPDGNITLTFSDSGDAAGGSIDISPVANQYGTTTITVTADDGEASNNTVVDTFVLTVNAVNDPPTVSDIADQSVDEDGSITGIAFTADEDDQGDLANEDFQTVTVTATSSDQALIPDANITVNFSDPGDTTGGTIDITPAANLNGNATITVTVDDGQAANNAVVDTFVVTVNAVNDQPAISDIANQTTNEDTAITGISFTADEDNQGDLANEDSQTVTVTAVSSDQSIVPDGNITVNFADGGDAAGGTIDITPVANANGVVTITVTVDDGEASNNTAVDTFDLTVSNVNDAPEKIGADYAITVDEDPGTINVDFAFGTYFDDVDVAHEGDTITYTVQVDETADTWVVTPLFDLTNYTFDTGTDNVTLTVNDDASGTATVTVFATDAAGASSASLVVTITVNQLLDDAPIANDDSYTMDEDDPPLVLEVLANDYIGDGPTEVTLAGVGFKDPENDGVWEQCTPDVANDPDCTQAQADLDPPRAIFHGSSGTYVRNPSLDTDDFKVNRVRCINCATSTANVTFDSNFTEAYILYTPRPDFNGVDTFDYTITDVDGNTSTATVTITVNAVNDAPDITPNNIAYTIDQGTTLQADISAGIASRVFDRDNTIYDGLGCDPRLATCTDMDTLYFSIKQATTQDGNGNTIANIDPPYCCDGVIDYTPVASFTGTDTFLFDVCDVPFADAEPSNCTFDLEVTVNVLPVSGAAQGSVEEVVEFDYDFSESPLELPVPSIPNVTVLMDDSSPMIIDMMTSESGGIYYYANGDFVDYIFEDTTTGPTIAPGEEAAPENGLWRLRTKDYNKIYYNPEFRYEPWAGLDNDGNVFIDAAPTAAYTNPWTQLKTIDLTAIQSYSTKAPEGGATTTCTEAPNNPRVKVDNPSPPPAQVFCDQSITDPDDPLFCPVVCTTESGSSNVTTNIYLPRYYVWDDKDGDGEVDATPGWYTDSTNTEGILVEIKAETGADEGLSSYPEGFDDGSDTYPKSEFRTDCVTNTDSCTLAEELQNFANYYTYARTREFAAKFALGAVIADAENMRVGVGFINGNNNNEPVREMNEASDTGNKATLLNSIYTNFPSGGTALRARLQEIGAYYADENQQAFTGVNGDDPVLPAPEGNCQQNYALLVTAGVWDDNWGGFGGADADADGILTKDGGGVSDFDGGAFAGCSGADCDLTLADIAMYYYETDLRPTLDDEVPTTARDLALADESAFSNIDVMHQHMATFVVGFGIEGTIASEPVDYTAPFDWGDPLTDEGKINDLRHTAYNGRGAYLDAGNPQELKTALEEAFEEFATGIGTASAVSFNSQEISQGSLVFRAFYNIKDNTGDLIAQTFNEAGEITDTVWSAAAMMDSVGFDNREIITYDPDNHVGTPFRATDVTCNLSNAYTNNACLTADQYDALIEFTDGTELQQVTDRVNYFRGDASNERPSGVFRERPDLEGRLGDIVNASPVFVGPPSLLRRTNEPYPQGDDIYTIFQDQNVNRQSLIYVAANDGMMHAFDADTGAEHFAFVPNAVITGNFNRNIVELLNYEYQHKYVMDLTPAVNDVFITPNGGSDKSWRTMVVGGYGAGGKGYFAIDGTDPSVMNEADGDNVVMWEFTDEDDTYPTDAHDGSGSALTNADGSQRLDLQSTPQPVKDLGYSFSVPTIAMSNIVDDDGENEWVVVFGNGFNSTSGIAKLFVLFADKGTDGVWCHPDSVFNDNLDETDGLRPGCDSSDQDFVKISTGFGVPTSGPKAGFPNGLGTPRAIDVDFNGTLDYVYAGDSLGNFYRFDLTSDNYADWSVTKIFEAVYSGTGTDELQPIYNRPLVIEHPTEEDGYVVIFATGSYITESDRTDDSVQTIYGIWDRLGPILITRDDLVEQQYTNVVDPVFGNVRHLSANEVPYSVADSVLGWYNDLDAVPAGEVQTDDPADAEFPGEKAIRNIQLRGGLVFVNSVIPRQEMSCTAKAGGFALAFCPGTGGTNCLGTQGIFDLNNDGLFNEGDEVAGSVVAGTRFEDAVPTDSTFFGGNRVTQLSDESLDITGTDTTGGANTGRLSWKRLDSIE